MGDTLLTLTKLIVKPFHTYRHSNDTTLSPWRTHLAFIILYCTYLYIKTELVSKKLCSCYLIIMIVSLCVELMIAIERILWWSKLLALVARFGVLLRNSFQEGFSASREECKRTLLLCMTIFFLSGSVSIGQAGVDSVSSVVFVTKTVRGYVVVSNPVSQLSNTLSLTQKETQRKSITSWILTTTAGRLL